MGANQIRLTELYLNATRTDDRALGFTSFPVKSMVTTRSADSAITDSAAAGTALATGHKTNNGVVSKDRKLKRAYATIAEKARNRKMRVGILTSVSINHATPAAFYAHHNHRSMYYAIAMDLGPSGFDFFGGGGFHQPRGASGNSMDAYAETRKNGYQIIRGRDALSAVSSRASKLLVMHPALLPAGEMPWAMEPSYRQFPLSEITEAAIVHLTNENGFFQMVEGGKIDWACHENDAAAMVHEVMAFNDVVKTAIGFYQKHPDETLIVVTADHETGGLDPGKDVTRKSLQVSLLQHQKLAAASLNAALYEQFRSGRPSFKAAMKRVTEETGLGDESRGLALGDGERLMFKQAFAFMTGGQASSLLNGSGYGGQERILQMGTLAIDILNRKAGIRWRSLSHSAADVPLFAIGVGAELFNRELDNTDVPGLIEQAMGW